jgi:hypothetical protein
MKKLMIVGVLLVMATALFAQAKVVPNATPNKDSRTVWQGNGSGDTPDLTYHLEIWGRDSTSEDVISVAAAKLLEFRKYGAVGFLVHATDGYFVALYATPAYEPQLTFQNTTKKYGLVSTTKAAIREALAGRTFREHITRAEFLDDLTIVYNGL